MCISTLKKKLLEQQADLEAKLAKVDAVENSVETAVKAVAELLQDCADALPDELPEVWRQILEMGQKYNLTVQPIAAEEFRQWEFAQAENEKLRLELDHTLGQLEEVRSQLAQMQATYLNPNPSPVLTQEESAEVAHRLNDFAQEVQRHRADDEKVLIGEEDDAAVEEELAKDDNKTQFILIPSFTELTELQKLLVNNNDFTFGEFHARVTVQSVFTEEEVETENDDDEDDPATEQVEDALFIVINFNGQERTYIHDAEDLVRSCRHLPTNIKVKAEEYARKFWEDAEKDAKIKEKIARYKADPATEYAIEVTPVAETATELVAAEEPTKPEDETRFELMGYKVQVFSQLPMGATFRFLDSERTVKFTNSLIAPELGDRSYKTIAEELIEKYQVAEKEKRDRIENPHKKPEDNFIQLEKIKNSVGYIKERATGRLIAGYVAFSNKTESGERTATQAKARANKWVEHFRTIPGLEVGEPRKPPKRMVSDVVISNFAYEVKITGAVSIEKLRLIAEWNFDLLPGEAAVSAVALPPGAPPLPEKPFTVTVNGRWLASGSEEEMRSRFSEELKLLGPLSQSVSLVVGSEVVERFAISDFEFKEEKDFDFQSPAYETIHLPSQKSFVIWRKGNKKWGCTQFPYLEIFEGREAAAADAVRRILRLEATPPAVE